VWAFQINKKISPCMCPGYILLVCIIIDRMCNRVYMWIHIYWQLQNTSRLPCLCWTSGKPLDSLVYAELQECSWTTFVYAELQETPWTAIPNQTHQWPCQGLWNFCVSETYLLLHLKLSRNSWAMTRYRHRLVGGSIWIKWMLWTTLTIICVA
jgi:hypothetical protein